MKREHISEAVGGISPEFIREAADYAPAKKRRTTSWKTIVLAAAMAALLIVPIAAYAGETVRFNAAVEYLRSKGFDVTEHSDYSRQDVIWTAEHWEFIDIPADPESSSLSPVDPSASLPPASPSKLTDVTSDQVRQLDPTMTLDEVIALLGDTLDVGSGICILLYRVDGAYTLHIPFAGSGSTQLGVTGEELLLALQPIQ